MYENGFQAPLMPNPGQFAYSRPVPQEMQQPVFPGPTLSPFPPSPMMPGPDMQQFQQAVSESSSHEDSVGHHCGKSKTSSHASTGPAPAPPSSQPYLHEQFRIGLDPVFAGIQPPVYPPYLHEQLQAGIGPMFMGLGVPAYYPANPASMLPADQSTFLGLNLSDGQFWKGALLGAGIVLLLTNDSLQRTFMKGAAMIFNAAQAGVEEMKEKFEDIQAEMKQKSQ